MVKVRILSKESPCVYSRHWLSSDYMVILFRGESTQSLKLYSLVVSLQRKNGLLSKNKFQRALNQTPELNDEGRVQDFKLEQVILELSILPSILCFNTLL